MKRCAIAFFAIACSLNGALGFASADQSSKPRNGDLLGTKFKLLEIAGENHDLCIQARDSLNQPTIYDGNDLAASLLATEAAMMWQIMDRSAGGARPFRTVGEFRNHRNRTDRLELDLNGDGAAEQITRRWMEIKGQTYTTLSLGSEPAIEPITNETLHTALGKSSEQYLDSSYFLFEVAEFDLKPFVIALATINTGIEWPDRFTYLVHFNVAMQPVVDCVMKTTIFGN